MRYEGNSDAEKSKKTKTKPVVKGKVKEKSTMDTFKNSLREDAENVKSYVMEDVLIPALKKAISDIVRNGIDMVLYGESRPRRDNDRERPYRRYSYSSISRRDRDRDDYDRRERRRERYRASGIEDILLDTKPEADELLMAMEDIIDEYGTLSILDVYDLAGVSTSFTDAKYGWTDIRQARIMHCSDGYYIKMPKALPLD